MAAPQAPSNLSLTPGTTTVDLSWQDNSNDESGFKIFRNDKLIHITNADETHFKDSGLTPDTTYRYIVKATDDLEIEKIDLQLDNDNLTLSMRGRFSGDAHYDFFIDADNDEGSGYSKDSIRGADYLVEDGQIYRYPEGANGWKWTKVDGAVKTQKTKDLVTFRIPAKLLLHGSTIRIGAAVGTHDYSQIVHYSKMSIFSLTSDDTQLAETTFEEKDTPLKNPLKGLMIASYDTTSPRSYVSLYKGPILWRDIEKTRQDGVEKIRQYSENHLFNNSVGNVENLNIKVNPLVVLKHDKVTDDYSPDDMDISEHDNQTQIFADRVKNLVKKLGEAWDNDPRIGFIYMGLVGTWGEQFKPHVSPMMSKVLGDSFKKAFPHKKVLVRLPGYFNDSYLNAHNHRYLGAHYDGGYEFGMYWDAFAWEEELNNELDTQGIIDTFPWRSEPMLGEVAFNADSKNYYHYQHTKDDERNKKLVREAIHNTLTHEKSLDYIKDYIYITHATALSWISEYDERDPKENSAARELQKALGYRYVLQKALYTKRVDSDRKLHIRFTVKNVGSAPFYYHWPLKANLLDPQNKKPVWSGTFGTDIRNWLPGDKWDRDANRYRIPAETYTVDQVFKIPESINDGEYILALSINDPAGDRPSVRFANKRYFKGAWTPIAMIGINSDPTHPLPASDDPQAPYLHLTAPGFIPAHGSPQLYWSGAPEGTKSFAIIVDDYDAPGINREGNYLHWIVVNIDSKIHQVRASSVPNYFTVLSNEEGHKAYRDPEYPKTHKYVVHIYAVSVRDIGTVKEYDSNEKYDHIEFEKRFKNYILDKAEVSSK